MARYEVDAERCIRCGVSMNQAPMIFGVDAEHAYVIRQPQSEEEQALAEQARAMCPVNAVLLGEDENREA